MDLVPRVEVSGGTTYRIVCKDGALNCHSKTLSLCEALIMCRHPYYHSYCLGIAGVDIVKIKELEKISELDKT